jgi:hypothetical protein
VWAMRGVVPAEVPASGAGAERLRCTSRTLHWPALHGLWDLLLLLSRARGYHRVPAADARPRNARVKQSAGADLKVCEGATNS